MVTAEITHAGGGTMEREDWSLGLNLLLENLIEQAMVARAREHNRGKKTNVIKNYVISPDVYQL